MPSGDRELHEPVEEQAATLRSAPPGAATTNVTFTASIAGTYYLGIKYSTGSIVGSGPAAPTAGASYTFASSGSTSKLALRHK